MPITLFDNACTSDAADTTTTVTEQPGLTSVVPAYGDGIIATPQSLSTAASLRSEPSALLAVVSADDEEAARVGPVGLCEEDAMDIDIRETDSGVVEIMGAQGGGTQEAAGEAIQQQAGKHEEAGSCSTASDAVPLLGAEEAARVLGGQVRAAGCCTLCASSTMRLEST